MADTATAELDTAPPPAEATEALEESPESELLEGTETDNGSEVETDSVEATDGEEDEEDGEPPEPEVISKEEHEKALKAERAKLEESFRQKTENAQKQAEDAARAEAFKANVTRAAQARTAATYQQIAGAIKDVIKRREDGEEIDLSPQWLQGIAAQQADAAFWEEDASYASAFDAYMAQENPGWRKPPEIAAAVERALHLHPSDPNRVPQVFVARLKAMEAAARELLEPKLREEIEAKVREELGAAKKTAAMKEADAARAAQPKPTGVGGSGAGASKLTSLADFEKKLSRDGLTDNEWAAYERIRARAGLR